MFQQFSTLQPQEKQNKNPGFFERYSNLKTPVKFEELTKEANSVFIGENEKLQGLNFTYINPITQSGFHACSTVHQFQLISDGMTPCDYSPAVQYRTKTSTGFCRIDTQSWIAQAVLQQKFLNEKLKLDMNYNNYTHAINTKLNYKGPSYHVSGSYNTGKDEVSASFMQSLTPKLSAGVGMKFENESGESKLSTGVRYHKKDDLTLSAEYKLQPNGLNNTKVLKLAFYEKTRLDLQMAGQLTFNLSETKTSFKYGLIRNFIGSQVQVMVDQDSNLSVGFEQSIGQRVSLQTMCDWDPEKSSLKYGIGVQVTPN
eukprot:gene3593-6328_t